MKILGAIVNPLVNSKRRMEAAGLCTSEQYDAAEVELLYRMASYYAYKNEGKFLICYLVQTVYLTLSLKRRTSS